MTLVAFLKQLFVLVSSPCAARTALLALQFTEDTARGVSFFFCLISTSFLIGFSDSTDRKALRKNERTTQENFEF